MSSSKTISDGVWRYDWYAEKVRRQGPVVFTNGCFDVLHPGHMAIFKHCHDLANDFGPSGKVIVGINSDESIRRIKGPDRPIMDQGARYCLVRSCRWVDDAIIFEEDTPIDLIRHLKPDYIVKGTDYTGKDVVGSDIAEVVILPAHQWEPKHSTTNLVEKIRGR